MQNASAHGLSSAHLHRPPAERGSVPVRRPAATAASPTSTSAPRARRSAARSAARRKPAAGASRARIPGRPTCAGRPTRSTGAASCRSRRAYRVQGSSVTPPGQQPRAEVELLRQRELETGAAERPSCRCQLAAVELDGVAHHREPEAVALASSRRRARHARTPARDRVREMPGPSSSTTMLQTARARCRRRASTLTAMRTSTAAPFARVVEQVAQQLGQVAAVADELRLGRDRGLEREILVARRPSSARRAARATIGATSTGAWPSSAPPDGRGAFQLVLDDAGHAVDLAPIERAAVAGACAAAERLRASRRAASSGCARGCRACRDSARRACARLSSSALRLSATPLSSRG